MSLAARYLEAHGVPTVVMGCAWDIVMHARVPRFLWSNFPLGHSAGKPFDASSQDDTLAQALNLFNQAGEPIATRNPSRWADSDAWQSDFMSIDSLSPEQLERLRSSFDADKQVAKKNMTP